MRPSFAAMAATSADDKYTSASSPRRLGKLKDNKLKKLLDQSQRIMQSVDNLTNNYFELKMHF
jgi:hypothetical protein